jgi:hypothetical protein
MEPSNKRVQSLGPALWFLGEIKPIEAEAIGGMNGVIEP